MALSPHSEETIMAIVTDAEYQHSKEQAERIKRDLKEKENSLTSTGHTEMQKKNLLDPLRSWLAGMEDEIADYETRTARDKKK